MADQLLKMMNPKLVLTIAAAVLTIGNAGAIFILIKKPQSSRIAQPITPPSALAFGAAPDTRALDERPLFDQSRKTSRVAAAAQSETPLKLTPKGTSISGDRRTVVMQSADGPVVLSEGETRYGVKVITVSAHSVVLETDGGRETIALF